MEVVRGIVKGLRLMAHGLASPESCSDRLELLIDNGQAIAIDDRDTSSQVFYGLCDRNQEAADDTEVACFCVRVDCKFRLFVRIFSFSRNDIRAELEACYPGASIVSDDLKLYPPGTTHIPYDEED